MSPEDRAKSAPVDYLMLSCAGLWVAGQWGLGDGTGLNLNKFDRETMAAQSDRNFKDAPSAYNTFFTTVARRYRSGFWCLRNPIIADADTGHGGITATMKCLGS